MSVQQDLGRLPVGEFAERIRPEMIPLNNQFSYFSAALSLTDEDLKEHLEEPIAALPSAICGLLPKVDLLLVPYLEKANGKENAGELVCFEKPADNRVAWSSQFRLWDEAVLIFALKDQEVADYHYRLYHQLAGLVADLSKSETRNQYHGILREELSSGVHGEVDEKSWHLKQAMLRRQTNMRRETKAFLNYAHQSFTDTLTLYLHGICCDIDVETGPRQLPSRHLRRRLQLLLSLYPPPSGYAVFPEELNHLRDSE